MAKNNKEKRFELLEREGLGAAREVNIIRDKQTGVQYLYYQSGYAGGLTPLLDKDGNTIISGIAE